MPVSPASPSSYVFEPIGVVRSPFDERVEAPRQAAAAREAVGRIELFPGRGFEDALEGLSGWDYAWVLFVFHKNVEQARGWKPKVLPPRATEKQGVFATRSPHRPNPIGMSAVRIERVEGLVVHVRELDILDSTPVLDLKPDVPYADAHPDARSGWLEARDPRPRWEVAFDAEPAAQLAWLLERGVDLRRATGLARAGARGGALHPAVARLVDVAGLARTAREARSVRRRGGRYGDQRDHRASPGRDGHRHHRRGRLSSRSLPHRRGHAHGYAFGSADAS